MTTTLMKFNAARRTLAEARSIDEFKDVINKADALRQYVKRQGESLEMQNNFAEIKQRAIRRAAAILSEMERGKPGPQLPASVAGNSDYRQALIDNDISERTARYWQMWLRLSGDEFEQHLAKTQSAGLELTDASTIKLIKSKNGVSVHFSSETPEWYTPPEIIKRVLALLGEIDLDPCSNSHETPNVPAANHFTAADDGLTQAWHGRIYMNPPYGREIGDWIEHLCHQFETGNVTEALALVPSRTDTAWFRQLRRFPRCFIWGRLKFSEHDVGAPFPSMVVYLGDSVKLFIEIFCDIGDIYSLVQNV